VADVLRALIRYADSGSLLTSGVYVIIAAG
jgi:hypothetical protein